MTFLFSHSTLCSYSNIKVFLSFNIFSFYSRQNRILSRKQILTYIGRVGPKETDYSVLLLNLLHNEDLSNLLHIASLVLYDIHIAQFVHCLICCTLLDLLHFA